MTIQQQKINEGNEKIAKFLGWFQEEDRDDVWFEKSDFAIIVAYHKDQYYPHRDLPFHRDWGWMMKVLDRVELECGACIIISNYSRDKSVKNELARHIGRGLTEDFYCDFSGSFVEDDKHRYFQISNIGLDKLMNVWETLIQFIDFYNDKTIHVFNYHEGKTDRKEHF